MLVEPCQITVHPEYNSSLFAHDLALIRMPHNLTYNTPSIAMIRLPPLSHAKEQYADVIAMITGFGRVNDKSIFTLLSFPIRSYTNPSNIWSP